MNCSLPRNSHGLYDERSLLHHTEILTAIHRAFLLCCAISLFYIICVISMLTIEKSLSKISWGQGRVKDNPLPQFFQFVCMNWRDCVRRGRNPLVFIMWKMNPGPQSTLRYANSTSLPFLQKCQLHLQSTARPLMKRWGFEPRGVGK